MKDYAVFLDVDGVINSLHHLYTGGKIEFGADVQPHEAGNYTIWVPDYMAELIQAIERSTDLYWLTTWRQEANNHISEQVLGISPNTPVIDDGTRQRAPHWKFDACLDLAIQLHDEGKTVLWIEDFGQMYDTRLDGYLKFIDTDYTGEGVLLPQHLPMDFMEHISTYGNYNGPTYVAPPARRHRLDAYSLYERNIGVPTA